MRYFSINCRLFSSSFISIEKLTFCESRPCAFLNIPLLPSLDGWIFLFSLATPPIATASSTPTPKKELCFLSRRVHYGGRGGINERAQPHCPRDERKREPFMPHLLYKILYSPPHAAPASCVCVCVMRRASGPLIKRERFFPEKSTALIQKCAKPYKRQERE